MASVRDHFLIQEHIRVPGEEQRADLFCVYCGRISEVPLKWIVGRAGDFMGCNHCGVVSRLPDMTAQPLEVS